MSRTATLVYLLIALKAFSQPDPEVLWTYHYDGTQCRLYDLLDTGEGTILAAGEAVDPENGDLDAFLLALDLNGDTLWTRFHGGSADDRARAVCASGDGGFMIVGDTRPAENDAWDIVLFRTDEDSHLLWTAVVGGPGEDLGRSICPVGDDQGGGFALAGTLGDDFAVFRIDADGDTLWTRSWRRLPGFKGIASSIRPCADGGFILAGQTYYDDFEWTSRYHLLMKIDQQGDSVWAHERYDSRLFAVVESQEGGFAALGEYQDAYMPLHRFSGSGEELWYQQYGSASENMMGRDIIEMDGGDFILTGRWQTGPGQMDAFLMRTDSAGEEAWLQAVPFCGMDAAYTCLSDGMGGFLLAGGCSPAEEGYIVRTGPDAASAVSRSGFAGPGILTLSAAPNPFNPSTLIRLRTLRGGMFTVDLFDIRGALVRRLLADRLGAGVHELLFAGSDLPSGVYVLRASGERESTAIRLLLAR